MNNRTIKFRVWDVLGKEWVNDDDYIGINNHGVVVNDRDNMEDLSLHTYAIIQQFTGLLDKNGKEIYEGDVLKISWTTPKSKEINGILFSDNYDRENVEQICSVIFNNGRFDCEPYCLLHNLFYINKNSEILGNIFENADLIKNHE